MAQTHLTISEAINEGIFATEFCGGCGKEAVRLYYLCTGMYAGTHYCRSCAKEALKAGDHL